MSEGEPSGDERQIGRSGTMGIKIEKLLHSYGAAISGLELAGEVDEATFAEIERAFETYSLLVFPGQKLTDEQQVVFSRRFGELETTVSGRLGGPREVANLSNVDENDSTMGDDDERMVYHSGNQIWHTDSSFKKVPAKASLLSGREVPPEGGETEFACMRLAYDALPEEKKRRLAGLVAEHDFRYSQSLVNAKFLQADELDAMPAVPQAVVRTIRSNGVKTLYVGRHAARIIGMDEDGGRDLLKELLEWCVQPRFCYLHKWQANDLVMWDNRCMLHRGRPWDTAQYRRVMHRTTVAGDGPAI